VTYSIPRKFFDHCASIGITVPAIAGETSRTYRIDSDDVHLPHLIVEAKALARYDAKPFSMEAAAHSFLHQLRRQGCEAAFIAQKFGRYTVVA